MIILFNKGGYIMKKTKDTNIILKRIKKALALLTIANYLAFLQLLHILTTSGIGAKILDYIFIIY